MLITNYSYINKVLGRNHSGITNPCKYFKPEVVRNYFSPHDITNIETIKRDSIPSGNNSPYAVAMGPKGALLSSTTLLNSESSLQGSIASGINIAATLEGSSSISTASLSLVTSLAAALAGSGNISAAGLVGTIALAATITSSGDLNAGLNLVSFMSSVISSSGGLAANLRGTLSMDATIYVNQSEATVQQLVAGVWNAIALDFNTAGTMGAAVNAAGTAGDPWIASLPGAYAPGTAGSILGNLLADMPDAFWDELKTAHTGANSYGKIVQDLETLAKQIKSMTAAGL